MVKGSEVFMWINNGWQPVGFASGSFTFKNSWAETPEYEDSPITTIVEGMAFLFNQVGDATVQATTAFQKFAASVEDQPEDDDFTPGENCLF